MGTEPASRKKAFAFMLKQILVWMLMLVLARPGGAQVKLAGEVRLDDGQPAPGAFVSLVLSDSITIKKFTATDGTGRWSLGTIAPCACLLQVRYLGYKVSFYPLELPGRDSLFVVLRLTPESLILPGVVVKGDAIGITRQGDTLKFNLKYFSAGDEITLGDVLNRLPGLQVDENGTVTYRGKPVEKLLIHGKDVLAGKHKLATESIRADQLAGVHLIENYRDATDIETRKSGVTAVDVRIKKDELDKWSGQVALYGGYDKKWREDAGLFKLTDRLGVASFIKANNTGQEALSRQDYIKIQGSDIFRRLSPYGDPDDLYPDDFKVAPQTTKNLYAMAAGGFDYDIRPGHQLRGNVILGSLSRTEARNFIRTLLNGAGDWTGTMTGDISHPLFSMDVVTKNKVSSSFFWSLGLRGGLEQKEKTDLSEGLYNVTGFKWTNTHREHSHRIAPELKIKYFPVRRLHLIGSALYEHRRASVHRILSDIIPIAGDTVPPADGLYVLSQDKLTKAQTWQQELTARWDLTNAWYVQADAQYVAGRAHRTYYSPDNQMFTADIMSAQLRTTYKFLVALDTTHWSLKAGISQLRYHLNLNNETARPAPQWLPNLLLKYSFSAPNSIKRFLMFTARTDAIALSPGYGGMVWEPLDSRQVLSPEADWAHTEKNNNYALSYLDITSNGRFVYVLCSYTDRRNSLVRDLVAFDDYSLVKWTRAPRMENWLVRFHYRTRIANKLVTHLHYRMTDIRTYSARDNILSAWRQRQHEVTVSFFSAWKKPVGIRLEYSFSLGKRRFDAAPPVSFSAHRPGMRISYHRKKSFRSELQLKYHHDYGSNVVSQNWRLNLDLSYRYKMWDFFLQGHNLLNLTPDERVDIRFDPLYTEVLTYHNFPGYILLGLGRRL